MKKIKCILSLLLAVVMVSSLAVPVSASLFPFTDVPTTHAYYDAIKFVYDHGIMNGTGDTTFSPSGNMVRATAVVTLWRMAGHPQVAADMNFTDVPSSEWYYDAVCWAVETGITTGTTPTTFEPLRNVTQQELLIFLYRYAVSEDCCNLSFALPDPTRMTDRLDDSDYLYWIAPVSYDAVNWAMNCGILDDDLYYFDGDGVALRYTCADYLYKFMTLGIPEGKAFVASEFNLSGGMEEIATILGNCGSYAYVQEDLYAIALEYAFYNSERVYISCHGNETGTGIYPQTNLNEELSYNEIDRGKMNSVRLVYLSACYAGGTFGRTLWETGGADVVIGFTEPVEYIHDEDEEEYEGIEYFDVMVLEYLSAGYGNREAVDLARRDLLKKFGDDYGASSVVVYPDDVQ